ncbi:apical endosomal glycoprotein, partial [Nephila pilipes]
IFLSGIVGNHTLGYIAIDDISISDGVCEDKTDLFDCTNGQHVLQTDVCNFHKDCSNGRDELMCADCDFESNQCGWTSDNPYQYYRWIRSRAGKEGLEFDHTKLDTSGNFMVASSTAYMWSAPLTTTLQSVVLRNAFSTCTLEFWYSLLNTIKLSVNLNRNNKTVQIWVPEVNSNQVWTKGEVFLGRLPRTFQ